MAPADTIDPRIRFNVTLKEYIDTFPKRRIERICTQFEADNRYIYKIYIPKEGQKIYLHNENVCFQELYDI